MHVQWHKQRARAHHPPTHNNTKTTTPTKGINTAIYSPSGASNGVGFAIPSNVVRSSVAQIIATGKVVRPVLGISFAPDASSEQLGVKGILVLSAREGSPAARAGIRGTSRDDFGRLVLGDIITGVAGTKVRV